MQDGIIKGNGNSRYLKSVAEFLTLYPTYENFAQALMAGTLPIDLNGVNAEGWSQQGTLLNKAALLKDATAALYGLGTAAVPDEVLAQLAPWQLIQSYKTAGSYTFTAPDYFGDGLPYELGVYMMGGGGSGGAKANSTTASSGALASGGASGYGRNKIFTVTPGQKISVVVGSGGAAVSAISGSSQLVGEDGGTTSFNGVTVKGGEGGRYGNAQSASDACGGASGGQGSDAGGNLKQNTTRNNLFAGAVTKDIKDYSGGLSQSPKESQNWFDYTMVSLAAGGSCYSPKGMAETYYQIVEALPDGTKGGNGNGGNATGNGNGGGGITGSTDASRTSGTGSPGAIYIYARKAVTLT